MPVEDTQNVKIGEVELFNGQNFKTINEMTNESTRRIDIAEVARVQNKENHEWREFISNRVSFLFPGTSHDFKEVTMDEVRSARQKADDDKPESHGKIIIE